MGQIFISVTVIYSSVHMNGLKNTASVESFDSIMWSSVKHLQQKHAVN